MLYKSNDVLWIAPLFVSEVTTALSIQSLQDCIKEKEEPEAILMYRNLLRLQRIQEEIEEINADIFKILNNTPSIRDESLGHSRAMMNYADKMAGRI